MKLIDAIQQLDRNSPANVARYEGDLPGDDPNLPALISKLNINLCYDWDKEFSSRMRKLWLASWICTDTRVGLAVYELDGRPVAVSTQSARKNDEAIHFLSKESAEQVRKVIFELLCKEGTMPNVLDSLDSDVSPWFEGAEDTGND